MRKRNYTKYSVDMYENRKMKIINKMEQRDLICYIWLRLVNLATIVDKDGDLYVTTKMPYDINTLAIEFDRSEKEIETALDILLELEMIVCSDNVYRVKNWTSHQVRRKKKAEEVVNAKEVQEKKDVSNKQEDKLCNAEGLDKTSDNKKLKLADTIENSKINNKDVLKEDKNMVKSEEDKKPKSQKKRKNTAKKEGNVVSFNLSDNCLNDEEAECLTVAEDDTEDDIVRIVDDWKPGPDDIVIKEWVFD